MSQTHYFCQPANFPDIDLGGGLYHGRYLDYYDRARQQILTDYGLSYADLFRQNIALVVGEMTLRYTKPIKFGDTVHIYTTAFDLHSKTIKFKQIMTKEKAPITDIKIIESEKMCVNSATFTMVCVDLSVEKSMPVPLELVKAFS